MVLASALRDACNPNNFEARPRSLTSRPGVRRTAGSARGISSSKPCNGPTTRSSACSRTSRRQGRSRQTSTGPNLRPPKTVDPSPPRTGLMYSHFRQTRRHPVQPLVAICGSLQSRQPQWCEFHNRSPRSTQRDGRDMQNQAMFLSTR